MLHLYDLKINKFILSSKQKIFFNYFFLHLTGMRLKSIFVFVKILFLSLDFLVMILDYEINCFIIR